MKLNFFKAMDFSKSKNLCDNLLFFLKLLKQHHICVAYQSLYTYIYYEN